MRLKVFDLLNKRKRLRVLEDGNQQVQVQCEIINVNSPSPPPPSSVVSPSLTHSPWTKSQQQLWSAIVYLTIIPRVRVGYEIIDSYNHLISNKREFKLWFH